MISISPGFSGIKDRGVRECTPDEKFKATVETLAIGLGGMLVTKSFVPLVFPFAYVALEAWWFRKLDEVGTNNGNY